MESLGGQQRVFEHECPSVAAETGGLPRFHLVEYPVSPGYITEDMIKNARVEVSYGDGRFWTIGSPGICSPYCRCFRAAPIVVAKYPDDIIISA